MFLEYLFSARSEINENIQLQKLDDSDIIVALSRLTHVYLGPYTTNGSESNLSN